MSNTEKQYQQIIETCKATYINKVKDYGTSWRVLRPISITDQIYIKAMRIRQIQMSGVNKIGDSIEGEFKAIINYGIIACINLEINNYNDNWHLENEEAIKAYEKFAGQIFTLMQNKNHDYGEAWRSMSVEGITDMILTKLLRIRQILANDGATIASEGIDANFHDIVNYSVFSLILLEEQKA
jgi:hypothetical protein